MIHLKLSLRQLDDNATIANSKPLPVYSIVFASILLHSSFSLHESPMLNGWYNSLTYHNYTHINFLFADKSLMYSMPLLRVDRTQLFCRSSLKHLVANSGCMECEITGRGGFIAPVDNARFPHSCKAVVVGSTPCWCAPCVCPPVPVLMNQLIWRDKFGYLLSEHRLNLGRWTAAAPAPSYDWP